MCLIWFGMVVLGEIWSMYYYLFCIDGYFFHGTDSIAKFKEIFWGYKTKWVIVVHCIALSFIPLGADKLNCTLIWLGYCYQPRIIWPGFIGKFCEIFEVFIATCILRIYLQHRMPTSLYRVLCTCIYNLYIPDTCIV